MREMQWHHYSGSHALAVSYDFHKLEKEREERRQVLHSRLLLDQIQAIQKAHNMEVRLNLTVLT